MAFIWNGNNNNATLNIEFSVSYKDHITTVPPTGMHKVKNIYWNPGTGKYDVEHDDTPQE